MRRVPLRSPEGRAMVERGPAWREHPDYYRDEPEEDDMESPQARIWVNEARTILLTQHPDGSFSVALREHPDAIWGPPIDVQPEGHDA